MTHDTIVTDVTAFCSFALDQKWRSKMPSVRCSSPWVKKIVDDSSKYIGYRFGNPEWHINVDESLCWEYLRRWQDEIEEVEACEGTEKALLFASTWMVNSVRWLLYRHFYATSNGIERWPEEWGYWEHEGNAAVQEYKEYLLIKSK